MKLKGCAASHKALYDETINAKNLTFFWVKNALKIHVVGKTSPCSATPSTLYALITLGVVKEL